MSSESFQTQNPATGEKLATYTHLSASEVEKRVENAFQSFHLAKSQTVREKSQQLKALGQGLRSHSAELSRLMTLEMGKALKDSLAEIEKCAVTFDYFAENLERFLSAEDVKSNYAKSKIVKDSLGPVLAIMPWNFPVWQVIRFAAPAVGIGNPILLKHADLCAGVAEKMEQIFREVDPNLLYNMRIDHTQAATLIGDKRVRGVTLTGSAKAGREVAATAGQHLKKSVLELGGSDAYVVFADSDVSKAGEICAKARMTNNGQSCVAAKRFIVEKSVRAQFVKSFTETLQKMPWGDPLKMETQVGSLASKKFQKQLFEQCQALEKGGSEKIFDFDSKFDFTKADAFFPSRIYLARKDQDMAFKEEFFGPVALVFDFENETEALGLANRSIYGLGGAVFTGDLERGEKFARGMEAGFIAINDQVKSDARLPFGGVKDSGYGRELSLYGFNEFCNIKTLGIGGEAQQDRKVE